MPQFEAIFNFLQVLPSLFYVDVYFSVLLSWVDIFYQIRNYTLNRRLGDRDSVRPEQGSRSIIALRIMFALFNTIVFFLLIAGAVCCTMLQLDKIEKRQYYTYCK